MGNITVGAKVIIHLHPLHDCFHLLNGCTGTVTFIWRDGTARVDFGGGRYTDVKVTELEIEQDDESRTGGWTSDCIASMEAAYEAGAFRDHMSA